MKQAPGFWFFGGKGGVGKTTLAAARAVRLAEGGARVLVVSADPAHSLGDALDQKLGASARRVAIRRGRGRLAALELDADRALGKWVGKRRAAFVDIAERGTYLDRDDVEELFGLSLPGVDELVGLLEIARLARVGEYDQVVVDTAPTGHTLRLLAMPGALRRVAEVLDTMGAKHRFMVERLRGAYAGDRSDDVVEEIDREGAALEELLRDGERTRFVLVTLAEELALEEARDAARGLGQLGVAVAEVVVNRVTPRPRGKCGYCEARVAWEGGVVEEVRAAFPGVRVGLVMALEEEPRGVGALRGIRVVVGTDKNRARARAWARDGAEAPWVEGLRGCRLVMFAGKGGVGKTTCAATAAVELARDKKVLLLSVDPAHSLGDALALAVGDRERKVGGQLFARELDAMAAFRAQRERYRDAVDELFDTLRGGSRFDASFDRAVVHDLIDLAPPGLDELFAVWTLIDTLVGPKPRYDLIVLDLAPTGHAIRLLELPAAAHEWVRALLRILLKYRETVGLGELGSDLVELSRGLTRLEQLLRDPDGTRCVVVTRAAELPRRETVRLLAALRRLGITVAAQVVNAVTPGSCARCRRAAARERVEIRALPARPPRWLAPARVPPPRGLAALRHFGQSWHRWAA